MYRFMMMFVCIVEFKTRNAFFIVAAGFPGVDSWVWDGDGTPDSEHVIEQLRQTLEVEFPRCELWGWIPEVGLGEWIPEVRLVWLDSWGWTQGIGFLRLDSCDWIPEVGLGDWIPEVGLKGLDSWGWTQGIGFLRLDSCDWISEVGLVWLDS